MPAVGSQQVDQRFLFGQLQGRLAARIRRIGIGADQAGSSAVYSQSWKKPPSC